MYEGIEIFMMNIGDADSFIFLGHLPGGTFEAILIDGGNRKHADQILGTCSELGIRHFHHVVCTHPHDDHAGGLVEIVKSGQVSIGQAWVHGTHCSSTFAGEWFAYLGIQYKQVHAALNESLKTQQDLIGELNNIGVPVLSPFAGQKIGPFTVLGPSTDFYNQQCAFFKNVQQVGLLEQYYGQRIASILMGESGGDDDKTLGGVTSPENETSVIMYMEFNEKGYLFTGDAGLSALHSALKPYNFPDLKLDWMKVPHHGSRRNLNEAWINYLSPTTAFISASGSVKHPRRKLVNALKTAGTSVYSSHYPKERYSTWMRHGAGILPQRNLIDAIPLYDNP